MIFCFPMAGSGRRFIEAGYTMPKPLLQVAGKRLIERAVESVSQLDGRYEWIVSQEVASHPDFDGLLPPGCQHILPRLTLGSLDTVRLIADCLASTEELLICDCDSFLDPVELRDAVQMFRAVGAHGGVTVRRTEDPNCSYAELDHEWWVQSTREKDAYTPWSTTGPYWFRSAQQFLEASKKALASQHHSISPVYNFLSLVKACPVSTFHHLGTPEEFEQFKEDHESA